MVDYLARRSLGEDATEAQLRARRGWATTLYSSATPEVQEYLVQEVLAAFKVMRPRVKDKVHLADGKVLEGIVIASGLKVVKMLTEKDGETKELLVPTRDVVRVERAPRGGTELDSYATRRDRGREVVSGKAPGKGDQRKTK